MAEPAPHASAALDRIAFDNSYSRLPERLYARQAPEPVAAPSLIALNADLADSLGLDVDALRSEAGVEWLAGNRAAPGSDPLAMAYAGHQFGHFVPSLGDGRALLLGEIVDRDGVRRDLHLKGSGATAFSRGGDGRSSIGPVVREYLACEAMAALGVPTTRALAAVASGQAVLRHNGPEPGGLLLRVARSHVRVGTFEYFARRGDVEAVRTLADHVIERLYPELLDAEQPYLALFEAVLDRTATMVACWMNIGFIHGVMNTDNTSIAGETIDYGPFGFIDAFDPATCYSSIDRQGRYAWHRQPTIAHWNLARLAECLLILIDAEPERAIEQAEPLLDSFPERYEHQFRTRLAAKIGLPGADDSQLGLDLLERMHAGNADFTLTFRRLSGLALEDASGDEAVRELFDTPEAFDAWAIDWRRRLREVAPDDAARRAAMRAVNPALVLRNHLAEQAVDAAVEDLDFGPMRALHEALSRPYDDPPSDSPYVRPPRPEERVTETFCGT